MPNNGMQATRRSARLMPGVRRIETRQPMTRIAKSALGGMVGSIALLLSAGCSPSATRSADQQRAGTSKSALALLRERLVAVHAQRDPLAYAALHTEAAVFEWPAQAPVKGRAALETLMRENWVSRHDIRLTLKVSELSVHQDRAYEFGSYEETWLDPKGSQVTELGRYVAAYVLDGDHQWRISRFFGFMDSTSIK